MIVNEKIFREYDIRGVVGRDIDRSIANSIGRAYVSFLKKVNPEARVVSVGRDVRLSSKDLAEGLIQGIMGCGIDVYDVGVCPTPLQYFSLFKLNLDGGIMITGSHNPPEYNGFKISVGKDTIHGEDIQRLKEIVLVHAGIKQGLKKAWFIYDKIGEVKNYDIIKAYKDYMLKEFSYLNDSRFKRLKIVVDAGNGTGGLVAPDILNNIGCDVIPIYCEPDGNFPNHHPDPTVVEYIQDLISKTKKLGADMGVGYDGDSDRIGIVNRHGGIVWGDQVLIILSREILKRVQGAKIIGDVKCSQVLFDDVKKHGGAPIMWKTGHSLIKQKMKDEGAPVAGEFSGHIFIKDRYFGYDDAIYTTLRLVEIMKTTGHDIKELLTDIPIMHYTPEIRIDCPEDGKKEVVKRIVDRFIKYKERGDSPYKIININTIDGVRVIFENGWGLLRMSNTQPVVVMRIEAEDEDAMNGYKAFMEKEFRGALETI